MSNLSSDFNNRKSNLELQQAIEAASQNARFHNLVHGLTDICWEICVPGRPSARLEPRTESCLGNCVERFIDTANFIQNRPLRGRSSSSESFADD